MSLTSRIRWFYSAISKRSARSAKPFSVVKKRTGHHEGTIRELFIRDTGIEVGAPLDNFRGVLSGIPELLKVRPASLGPRKRRDEKKR